MNHLLAPNAWNLKKWLHNLNEMVARIAKDAEQPHEGQLLPRRISKAEF